MNNFEKNCAILNKMNPDFYLSLKNSMEQKCLWWKELPNGNYSVFADNNEVLYAYDNIAPKETIEQMLGDMKFLDGDVSVIIGAGAGFLLDSILSRKSEKHIIVLIETEMALLIDVLKKYNFEKHLKNTSLQLITNKNYIPAVFNMLDNAMVVEEWHVFRDSYCQYKLSIYQSILETVSGTITQIQCNNGTVASAGKEFATNDIKNLPYLLHHPGIAELKNIFKNKPAVLVSTGPSLQKNIHKLIKAQNKVIIIAVAQAYRILLAYGIRPDFICTVDFGSVNETHFVGLWSIHEKLKIKPVPLICLNRSYAPIIQKWKGPCYVVATNNPGFENSAISALNDKGFLDQGGSVSHFMFSAARHLGCSPIALIGQDLALTDGLSHSPNADSMGKIEIKDGSIQWKVDDPKSPLLAKQINSMGPVVYVEGYFNEPVLSNVGLVSFLNAFEYMFEISKEKIYDCTEGGAVKRWTTRTSLNNFLNKNCHKKLNKSLPAVSFSPNAYDEKIYYTVMMLEKDIDDLEQALIATNDALETNEEVQEYLSIPEHKRKKINIKKIIAENKKFTLEAHEYAKKNPLVQIYIYHASRKIQSRELKAKSKINHLLKKNTPDLQIRTDRNALILNAAKDAFLELLDLYENTKKQLLEDIPKNISPEYTPLTQSEIQYYLDNNNIAWPFTDLIMADNPEIAIDYDMLLLSTIEKAEEQEKINNHDIIISYHELISQARTEGTEKKNFEKALKSLLQANKLLPDHYAAQWGIATCYNHLKKYPIAKTYYNKLVKQYPDVPAYLFERALVELNIEPMQAVKQLKELLTQFPQHYQYFWRNLALMYKGAGMDAEYEYCKQKYINLYPADKSFFK